MSEATARNAFHLIRSLQVKGGFLDGVRVAFNDDLNCVIGGRGTGKTTVLEFLRWALDQLPDQRTSPNLRKNIEKLVQAILETESSKLRSRRILASAIW
jgi:DNA repair exonuclease SbcCD ATPase subunit